MGGSGGSDINTGVADSDVANPGEWGMGGPGGNASAGLTGNGYGGGGGGGGLNNAGGTGSPGILIVTW